MNLTYNYIVDLLYLNCLKKKYIILLICSFYSFYSNCYSQQIIKNGDFEFYDTLPDINGQITRAVPWKHISRNSDFWYNNVWLPWFDLSLFAKSGNGFAGFGNDSRGYGCEFFGQNISVNPLLRGKKYKVGAFCQTVGKQIWGDNCSQLAFYGFEREVLIDSYWIRPTNIPNAILLWESSMISNLTWELKEGEFISPSNINFITISLNNSCNQYVIIDSIFCTKVEDTLNNVDSCIILYPNAFSPNEDNLNDNFKPISNCEPKKYELKIFNRWGELIFNSNRFSDYWDGKYKNNYCSSGVYVYFSIYSNTDNVEKIKKGNITLIR